MAPRTGRPRKAGERYASGGLKETGHEGDVRAPTLWRRIKDGAVRGAAHPYAGTVLGRLSIFGCLGDPEVEAGFRVAEIVGRYERLTALPRRSAPSPAYEQGYGSASEPYSSSDPALMARYEQRVRNAVTAYERLLDQVPQRGRDALFTVCVDDREINSLLHEDLRVTLRHLAGSFGFAAGGRGARRKSARSRAPEPKHPSLPRSPT
jgi:hypothetical protein